ncbi:MAG: class I SAM-dependent methyltransferase [Thermodesulfovibrionales bacterium]
MEKVSEQCALCGGVDCEIFRKFKSQPGASLLRCLNCGLVRAKPMPSDEEIAAFYEKDEIGQTMTSSDAAVSDCLLSIIEAYQPKGRLIDIGTWYGDFLVAAKKRGWNVAGVELSLKACEFLTTKHDITMIHGTVTDATKHFGRGSFDVVTMFHVLEHIRLPADYMKDVSSLLKPGGLVFLRVPNVDAIMFSLLGKHWNQLGLPLHLYFYSPFTIQAMLEKCGFDVVENRTLSCLSYNEVSELVRGTLKWLGVKKMLSALRTSKGNSGPRDQRQGAAASLAGALVNTATRPLFYATYPLWRYFEKTGRGSEILVVGKKTER